MSSSIDEKRTTPEMTTSAIEGEAATAAASADDDDSHPSSTNKKPRLTYDDSRRKEIRETNRMAARECRARKKRLMVELEKTVANLTAEHSALMKQNRELAIRLETLQRTAAMGLGPMPVPGGGVGVGAGGMQVNPNQLFGAGNPMGLLSSLNASLQTNPSIAFPGQTPAAAVAPGAAGGGGTIVHMHHYDQQPSTVNGKSIPQSPPPTMMNGGGLDLKALSKLGYLNQAAVLQQGGGGGGVPGQFLAGSSA